MPLLDARRGHGALGDGLVGAPVEYLDKNHAGKQGVPGDRRILASDQGQALAGNAGEVEIDGRQRQHHHQQAQAEQQHAAVGVGYGHRAQTAKHGVGRAGQCKADGNQHDGRLDIEHGLHKQRTAVEHGRQEYQHVAEQEQHADQGADVVVVVVLFEQFRGGGAVVLVVEGQKYPGQHNQPAGGGEFPPGQQGHLVAVHAHQLVRA